MCVVTLLWWDGNSHVRNVPNFFAVDFCDCWRYCGLQSGWVTLEMLYTNALPSVLWIAFSSLTLLVGQQEGHLACKKTEWWDAGMVILGRALRNLRRHSTSDNIEVLRIATADTQVRATSHKPDEIYGIIERLSPGTRKIELFGRPHNVQPNWWVHLYKFMSDCIACIDWRYVAIVVVLWHPALSASSSVTALRWESVNVHV